MPLKKFIASFAGILILTVMGLGCGLTVLLSYFYGWGPFTTPQGTEGGPETPHSGKALQETVSGDRPKK